MSILFKNRCAGCLNGGGQLRPEGDEPAKELLARVEGAYNSLRPTLPEENRQVEELYREWLDARSQEKLHTQYHAIEKSLVNPLAVQW